MNLEVATLGIDASWETRDASSLDVRVRGARCHYHDPMQRVWQGFLHVGMEQNAMKEYATSFPYAGDQGPSPRVPMCMLWEMYDMHGL